MPTPERPLPDVEPLVYFGNWCGPGWSAGHRATKPLTREDLRVPGKVVIGMTGVSRSSPVDQACKVHDILYDHADRAGDPLKRAQIILAADRQLLHTLSDLFDRQNNGKADLNIGEALFAQNMQIAFYPKLLLDGEHVANLTVRQALGPTGVAVTRVLVPGSILIFGVPQGFTHPVAIRLHPVDLSGLAYLPAP